MKTSKTSIITFVLVLILAGMNGKFAYDKNQIIQEQETEIEQLQNRNEVLQQERDEIYDDYSILRDQLWNLNKSLEEETNQ